jgi:hypothetical protein
MVTPSCCLPLVWRHVFGGSLRNLHPIPKTPILRPDAVKLETAPGAFSWMFITSQAGM